MTRKKMVEGGPRVSPRANGSVPTMNAAMDPKFAEMVQNILFSRTELMRKILDPRREIDDECGYPVDITAAQYRLMYDRNDIAARVVEVLPKETWQHSPSIYEDEDSETETDFETALKELDRGLRVKSWFESKDNQGSPLLEAMRRADILSGIGHFGIMLLGIDDGLPLDVPAKGFEGLDGYVAGTGTEAQYSVPLVNPQQPSNSGLPLDPSLEPNNPKSKPEAPFFSSGKKEGKGKKGTSAKLLYIRSFDESLVDIARFEADRTNPRYGLPVMYTVTMNDPANQLTGIGLNLATVSVHWSRVVHLADNLGSSEVFGPPRMKPVFNRLLDLRKTYGGSGEMYWRGAFPGLSLETNPQLGGDVTVDATAIKSQMFDYMNGLQRYLSLQGMSAKTLSPQVVDPNPHIAAFLEAICIVLGCPMRVFKGSERGELASDQDDSTWNGRLKDRQNNYCTPRIIVPLIDRLILLGVLPEPEQYYVDWPDLDALQPVEKATLALTRTDAMSKYVAGGIDALMTPLDYLMRELDFTQDEAMEILDAVIEHLEEAAPDAEAIVPGREPVMPPEELPPNAPVKMKEGEALIDPNDGKTIAKVKGKPTAFQPGKGK